MDETARLEFHVVEAGSRVFLGLPRPEDEEEYLNLIRASADFLRPWEPAPAPGTAPDSPERFARLLQQSETDTHAKFLIRKKEDATILGQIGINEMVRGSFQSGMLGYWIGGAHARQGYMTEALGLVLRHAFGALGLHRLEANLRPENEASRALVRRAGFTQEGYSRRYLQIAGDWRDHERWALLVEDWQPPLER